VKGQQAFWLLLTVAVSLGFAMRVSRPALNSPLVVHDDVRQHVFWVPRLHDPALFAHDWIADYYESQAPEGYRAVYWLLTLGMDAVQASKLLPLLLTVGLAVAGFGLGRAIWGRADAAALGTILLAWSAWQYDDIASATPRAYAMPLLVAQLALLAGGRWRWALLVLPLQALFYPLGCALAVLTMGTWALWRAGQAAPDATAGDTVSRGSAVGWRAATLALVRRAWSDLLWLAAATAVALGLVVAGRLEAAAYGPMVTAAQARAMPEFQQGGRAAYFVANWYQFWLESSRSGFALGPKDPLFDDLPALVLPFALAVLLGAWMLAGRLRLVRGPAVPGNGLLLLVLLGLSLLLYAAAHALLYALYLPARHVQFSLPIVWALAGGLCWCLLGDRLFGWVRSRSRVAVGLAGGELFALAGVALLTLHAPPPGEFYVTGRYPALYAFLRQTPPNTLVAALPADSNTLPMFGLRPILTSYEHAIPYQPGYYVPLHERTEAFRAAYYAPTLAPLAQVIREQRIGVVVADTTSLERRRRSERERPPALARALDRCGVVRERELVALMADCLLQAAESER